MGMDDEYKVQAKKEFKVILFYKYHPLAKDRETVELYRLALDNLCKSLKLRGRILVGCNENQSEGINGTLSGETIHVRMFVYALTNFQSPIEKDHSVVSEEFTSIIETFWNGCEDFIIKAKCKPLLMKSNEFKWSSSDSANLFPDLNVKVVNELIGTGGVLASIPLEEVHQGYLTPTEWHERVSKLDQEKDTLLIDCRNTKECQIGHFPEAIDPNTTTFNQFPTWVQKHSQTLANKKILMYCTGGIRCEKASAYIRREIPSVKEVRHLKGGIHKYLDAYGSSNDCLWEGKNFVFDGRGAHKASETSGSEVNNKDTRIKHKIVGTCNYCSNQWDSFDPNCVCTVCREPTLVCLECRKGLAEYHCKNHEHLRTCYFTDLSRFTGVQLKAQLSALQLLMDEIAVGRKFKQRRKTLKKQCDKILERLSELGDGESPTKIENQESKCRNCGTVGCSGLCWGFHGLKRKRILDERNEQLETENTPRDKSTKGMNGGRKANNLHLQQKKEDHKKYLVEELKALQLAMPPSEYTVESLRVPPPCIRVLQTNTKGKWCGQALLPVLQREFAELAKVERVKEILGHGLISVNNNKVLSLPQAESIKLKNMDKISRIVHWHEPPVYIPKVGIRVEKVTLPEAVKDEHSLEDAFVYICDKPSTVPVHPAGPYLSNSLTIMVEAQEGLEPRSLIPCHRIDRVTSGLTICCENPKVARLIQSQIDQGSVKKMYLAKVHGKFPRSSTEAEISCPPSNEVAKWQISDNNVIQMDAPIETVDPSNGIRAITNKGKVSTSLFQGLSYDADNDTSLVSCCPLTGRSHQLRVHLQWLGYSIVNDTLYGGRRSTDSTLPLTRGLERVVQSIKEQKVQGSSLRHVARGLSDDDVKAASNVCFCCRDVASAFTPSQLLQGGHGICLHAFRYQVPFVSKTSNNKTNPLSTLDFQVSYPIWAKKDSCETIQWLKR